MEPSDLDEGLRQLADDRCRRDRALAEEKDLVAELGDARGTVRQWEDLVARSRDDLRALEGLSLMRLVATLRGDRQERIDEEQKVLLRCKLKRDEAAAAIAPLEERLQAVRAVLAELAAVDAERDRLLAQKEQWLRDRGGETGARLVAAATASGELAAKVREIVEAEAAGEAALAELDQALEQLRRARSWGTIDLFGGGMLTSMVKHDRLDEGKRHVDRAQVALRRYARELADVDLRLPDLAIEIDGFTRFADLFLDNLFTDLFVQSRITGAYDRVFDAKRRVVELQRTLRGRLRDVEKEREAVEADRRSAIEDGG